MCRTVAAAFSDFAVLAQHPVPHRYRRQVGGSLAEASVHQKFDFYALTYVLDTRVYFGQVWLAGFCQSGAVFGFYSGKVSCLLGLMLSMSGVSLATARGC